MSTHHCHLHAQGHAHKHASFDWFFWLSFSFVAMLYIAAVFFRSLPFSLPTAVQTLSLTVFQLINTIWWGVLVGWLMIVILSLVPKEVIMGLLGNKPGLSGLLRATLAGLCFDVCSHGILMIAAKLYERGASIAQVMTFLIASPWNSFSTTFILIALIGLKWTLLFLLASVLIGLLTGIIFERLLKNGKITKNPNAIEGEALPFARALKLLLQSLFIRHQGLRTVLFKSLKEVRVIVRWLLLGILLTSLVRSLFTPEMMQHYFGPSLLGLALTVLGATIIEVCSEGATPLAAELLTQAKAPGNSFAFLMGSVSTDITEILVIKQFTRRLSIALLLPLLTLPQIVIIAILLNQYGGV